ncbi:DNA nucleotidylexotransferase isoform X2 [Gadus macrocephalus]|uniref:DNA nucleotidylexotransferase isoform X2 n=1 Tax=Gadus macrocephalus TaxID=80720 RepID=UPI0028CB8F6D|nr:DNA nucleotidylexotransferase isoform X2 [Gadus macrocephalus]
MLHAAMLPPMRKRQRRTEGTEGPRYGVEVKFPDVRLYLVEKKMGATRRGFLAQLARAKGFLVEDVLSERVTHVVSEQNQAEELWQWLRRQALNNLPTLHVLDIGWFTDSMREGRPVTLEARHHIQEILPEASTHLPVVVLSRYACQRRTSTENHNEIFTDAFEVMAESYEFSQCDGQCLAFRRAASVLKSVPWPVERLGAATRLPCLGEHTRAVMEEILQCGRSFEVEKILCNDRYQRLKLFTSVFGVGPKTAEKWHRGGLRTLNDALEDPGVELNSMQKAGFRHHGDISRAVSRAEALAVGEILHQAALGISAHAVLVLTGGFRRGKEFGHDVDFLLSTPEQGKEETLLLSLVDSLRRQGILLYCDHQPSTFDINNLPGVSFEAMDHFAKSFLILRLEDRLVEGGVQRPEGQHDGRSWRAVRVDVVAPPMERYAFALLGWTGSRQFERDLRRFARKEKRMLLDNHGLWDKTKKEFLEAEREEDIFAHLGLEYLEPQLRNA